MKSTSQLSWRQLLAHSATSVPALLALTVGSAFAQTQPTNRDPNSPSANPGANANDVTTPDQTQAPIQLTPFEVNATQEHGYFSPTTLAGTRLNNNIADLPSSISVVTRQELLDTNSQNINDVFRFEANTEGASTYTPVTLVRGNVADVLGNQPLVSGNRVRGLNAADLEMDNYFALSRIPFDTYNTQTLEIDRGPNSILFGTGSPAGIVNQTRTRAVLDKLKGEASLEVGSWGTFRDTVGINIPVWNDKLAVYVAQAYTDREFEQKPSSDLTRREYATFTFVPFNNHRTKLTGSFEYYNNTANDPNTITPVDFVTPWRQSGRPVYSPINNMVTFLSSGKTAGPYTQSTTSPGYAGILQSQLNITTSPYFVPSLSYAGGLHNIEFIDPNNTITGFYKQQQSNFSVAGYVPTTLTPAQAAVNQEKITWSTSLPAPSNFQIWQPPSVASDNVYDWRKINLNAMSTAQTAANTYFLDLQQEIIPNLNFDLGWFRQEFKQFADQPLSQANATTLYVDTNSYLLNGQANPHVGQSFVSAYASDLFVYKENNNNLRASLEYELNLADRVPDWLKWLGHHRLMVVASRHDDVQTNLRYRESIIGGDPNYLPTAAALTASAGYGYPLHNTAIEQWFYLGGTGLPDGNGTGAPGTLGRPGINSPTTGTISTYNYATGAWQNSTLQMQSILYPTGGLQENFQDSRTYFWQSFFWNDRIVGTAGLDDEHIKNRQTVFPSSNAEALEYTNGFPNTQYWYQYGPWNYTRGKTRTKGVVVHPLKNWEKIDSAANQGNLLAGLARTISLTYNESGNFNPPPAYYTDFFGNPLGKPQGAERDYGFEIATPDNRFFLRATWFKTTNENQLVSNTSNGRALYIDAIELKNWATAVVEVRNGINPSDPNFLNSSVNPITPAMQAQIAELTKLPYTFGGNVGENGQFVNPFETQNGIARGVEIEATYNPVRNWRMKFAWGQQKTTLSDISSQAAAWIAHRSPTWTGYTAPDLQQVYTRSNGEKLYLGDFWTGYGYDGNINTDNVFGWTNTQNYYNIVVAGQLATDRALNGTQATNQREYTWSYVTTYDFDRGALKGFSIGGGLRYLGRAIAGYYGDFNNLSPTGQVFQPDVRRPIYYPHEYHVDAWIGYQFALPWQNGRIHAKVQLNVSDLNIHSHLEPVTYNYDGTPAAQRIVLPRTYTLNTRFSF